MTGLYRSSKNYRRVARFFLQATLLFALSMTLNCSGGGGGSALGDGNSIPAAKIITDPKDELPIVMNATGEYEAAVTTTTETTTYKGLSN